VARFKHIPVILSVVFWAGYICAQTNEETESSLLKAYGHYLLGEYDSAVTYYQKAKRDDPGSIEPFYGLMNCYMVLGKYEDVITEGTEALKGGEDFYVLEKMARASALRNRSISADSIYEKAIEVAEDKQGEIPDYVVSDFVMNMGNCFLEVGNYRKAEQYFNKGEQRFGTEGFRLAVYRTKRLRRENARGHVNFSVGLLKYNESEEMNHGTYAGLNIGLFLRNADLLKFGCYNLSIRGPEAKAKKPEDPPPPPKPNLYQSDFYLSFTDFYHLIRKTKIQSGIRASISNIEYTDNSKTLFLEHSTNSGILSWGSTLYYTRLSEHNIAQISPMVALNFSQGKVSFNVKGVQNIIKSFAVSDKKSSIPGSIQLSGDLSFSVSMKQVRFTVTGSTGRRAFLNESEAVVILNVVERYLFGSKFLAEYTFEKIPLAVYSLLRHSHFQSYSSFTVLGGVFVQW
jgi:tetratricopeptide (TPR) repeat protein